MSAALALDWLHRELTGVPVRPPARRRVQLVHVVPQQEPIPGLRREGIAREPTGRHHRLRRDLGFAGSDPVQIWTFASDEAQPVIQLYNSWIAKKPLARGISLGELPIGQQASEPDLDGSIARVAISKEL